MKIVDYVCLRADTAADLSAAVRMAMKEGWTPLGSVAITAAGDGETLWTFYAQAMVKYAEEAK